MIEHVSILNPAREAELCWEGSKKIKQSKMVKKDLLHFFLVVLCMLYEETVYMSRNLNLQSKIL